jgi:hypothetical protein
VCDQVTVITANSWATLVSSASQLRLGRIALCLRVFAKSNRSPGFIGHNDSSTSADTITVDASGAGSVITYQADLEMKGARPNSPARR